MSCGQAAQSNKLSRIRYDLACDQGLKHPYVIMKGCEDQVKDRSQPKIAWRRRKGRGPPRMARRHGSATSWP